jgi:MFS transporter, ACS family, pantothenate transporter
MSTVTPGNKAAAVVAGLNVLVFITIAVLAHREKLAKKRAGTLPNPHQEPALTAELEVGEGNEKRMALGVQAVEIRNA